jgi:hypothetical protein
MQGLAARHLTGRDTWIIPPITDIFPVVTALVAMEATSILSRSAISALGTNRRDIFKRIIIVEQRRVDRPSVLDCFSVVGGMITSTIHVLILVPVFFVLMKKQRWSLGYKLRPIWVRPFPSFP